MAPGPGAAPALELPLGPVSFWEPHPLEAILGRSWRVSTSEGGTASACAAGAPSARGRNRRRVDAHMMQLTTEDRSIFSYLCTEEIAGS